MKKIAIITGILILALSIISTCYGAVSNNIKAKFKESDVSDTKFKEITITPYGSKYYDEDDDEEYTYYIYLPTGYFVEAASTSFIADRNGKYPFTVYDGKYKKTFTYIVDDIDEIEDEEDNEADEIHADFKLKYDYEKKSPLFYMHLDRQRQVSAPNGNFVTNEVNYYIDNLENNMPFDLSIDVEGKIYNYKIIKSGEFYLLIHISPVNYNDYSTVVEYFGYNFTNNESYEAVPAKDIYDDNGNYVVLVKSGNSQHIFNFNITGIDYRRPNVDLSLVNDDTLSLEAEDDFGLDYIITYDGKYVGIDGIEAEYSHSSEIKYVGEYIFTVVDKSGNRTVETITVKKGARTPRSKHKINLDVHDFSGTEKLFEDRGSRYEKPDEQKIFENILPAYMNGKSPVSFSPDSSISRAEMVTIFCRLNDLPYDTSAHLKSKFTDISTHWARDYISMGSSKRYVSGYKDKTFKPDNNVTRAEFCQMLTKISSYKSLLNSLPASNNIDYSDIHDHWAEKEIIKIAGRSLVTSNSNKFYPDRPITRGEVVHAINMLYGYNPSYLELSFVNSLYNKYYSFNDIAKHKYYNDIIISVVGMYREKIQ